MLNAPFGSLSTRSSKDKSTLGTEFGIGVNYAFTQNIAFSARYQLLWLLWLDKVAFAPQQVTVANYGTGRSTVAIDSVLYQGGWTGFILSW